jgi:hypothetical protein
MSVLTVNTMPLSDIQKRLCIENIRRCKAYAALPPEQKWPACLKRRPGKQRDYKARRLAVPISAVRVSLLDRVA